MRKIHAFLFITLNGYYKGDNEDISWHNHGEGEEEFSVENLTTGHILLFGRTTYEMMAGFWPTEQAATMYPEVAVGMNKAEKLVLSRTLQHAGWKGTTIVRSIDDIRMLKQTEGKDITILGSGTVVAQLAKEGLIDSYQIMVDPIAISEGTPIFEGVDVSLHLTSTRSFKSGAMLLHYTPKN